MTNFHLPRSTLFMLVSAFAGLERMRAAYAPRHRTRLSLLLLWRRQLAVQGRCPVEHSVPASRYDAGLRAEGLLVRPLMQIAIRILMSTDQFTFTVSKTDGAARTGEIRMPRGVIRTPAFMPVGTAATVKAMYPDQVKALGADVVLGNTYHLMLRPGRRAGGAARRTASIHELALSDPDGFRRLPGDVAGSPAQDRRDRRDLPVAYRRLDPCDDARTLDRDPGPARLRHPDAARRMREAAMHATRWPRRRCACPCAGRSAADRVRRPARQGDVRHRAGRRRRGASRSRAQRRSRHSTSRATPSAAWRSASRRTSCCA